MTMNRKAFTLLVLAMLVMANTSSFGQTTFERMIPMEGGDVTLPGPECHKAEDA